MVFSRPPSLPNPTIWHRFSVTRGARSVNLRVQDLTPELKEEALQLLATYFTRDEPPCKCIEINKHPAAVAELTALWRRTVEDNVSVVCIEDTDDGRQGALVGVNVLTVVCKEDKEEPFQTEDETWAMLFGAVDFVSRGVDVFSVYGVDKYLTAYGLVVDPAWRGCSIGAEILKARIPLCKALGIKATTTVFTAAASQAVAKKAGFETLYEVKYENLARRGFVFPGVEKLTETSKLMGMSVE